VCKKETIKGNEPGGGGLFPEANEQGKKNFPNGPMQGTYDQKGAFAARQCFEACSSHSERQVGEKNRDAVQQWDLPGGGGKRIGEKGSYKNEGTGGVEMNHINEKPARGTADRTSRKKTPPNATGPILLMRKELEKEADGGFER